MNSTRRHPRTLQEAFGPYTSRDVLPMRDQHSTPWTVSDIVIAVLVVGAAAAIFGGWL